MELARQIAAPTGRTPSCTGSNQESLDECEWKPADVGILVDGLNDRESEFR